jgi:hypothetical protein
MILKETGYKRVDRFLLSTDNYLVGICKHSTELSFSIKHEELECLGDFFLFSRTLLHGLAETYMAKELVFLETLGHVHAASNVPLEMCCIRYENNLPRPM